MDYGLQPPCRIDMSVEEAKLEEQIADAALRLRVDAPEMVSERLFADDRIVAAMQEVIATADCSGLLELIDDISRKLVIDGEAE